METSPFLLFGLLGPLAPAPPSLPGPRPSWPTPPPSPSLSLTDGVHLSAPSPPTASSLFSLSVLQEPQALPPALPRSPLPSLPPRALALEPRRTRAALLAHSTFPLFSVSLGKSSLAFGSRRKLEEAAVVVHAFCACSTAIEALPSFLVE